MNINVRIRNENFHGFSSVFGGNFLELVLMENCEKMISENLLGFLSKFKI
jgi:hypothetical protein